MQRGWTYAVRPCRQRARFGHGSPDFEDLVEWQHTFAKRFGQGFTFEEFHHQGIDAILLADVIEMGRCADGSARKWPGPPAPRYVSIPARMKDAKRESKSPLYDPSGYP